MIKILSFAGILMLAATTGFAKIKPVHIVLQSNTVNEAGNRVYFEGATVSCPNIGANGSVIGTIGQTNAAGVLDAQLDLKPAAQTYKLNFTLSNGISYSQTFNVIDQSVIEAPIEINLTKVTVPGAEFHIGEVNAGANGIWLPLSSGTYVFPGTHTVRMENLKVTLEVGGTDIVVNPYIVSIVNSANKPLKDKELKVSYFNPSVGDYVEVEPATSGRSLLLSDVNPEHLYTKVSYKGTSVKRMGGFAGSTVQFQTMPITVRLYNSSMGLAGMSAENVSYVNRETGATGQFNTLTNGVSTLELFPSNLDIVLTYNGISQSKEIQAGESEVNFHTRSVALIANNCTGEELTQNLSFYYSLPGHEQWALVGSSSNTVWVELLKDVTYHFKAELNDTRFEIRNQVFNENKQFYFDVVKLKVAMPAQDIESAKYAMNAKSVWTWGAMNISGDRHSAEMNVLGGVKHYVEVNETNWANRVLVCGENATFTFGQGLARMISVNTELTVFPNPAASFINVNMPEAGTISIFSMEGKKVSSQMMTAGANHVDISTFAAGTYMLVNGAKTVKFVKQ